MIEPKRKPGRPKGSLDRGTPQIDMTAEPVILTYATQCRFMRKLCYGEAEAVELAEHVARSGHEVTMWKPVARCAPSRQDLEWKVNKA